MERKAQALKSLSCQTMCDERSSSDQVGQSAFRILFLGADIKTNDICMQALLLPLLYPPPIPRESLVAG